MPRDTPTASRHRFHCSVAPRPFAGSVCLPPPRTRDWEHPELDFRRYSDSGVIGDAGHADAEVGRRVWAAAVEWLADYVIGRARGS